MAYYIDVFSPETYQAFSQSNMEVSGFRTKHKELARTLNPGDKLICYMTKLSRWMGVLEITSPSFSDATPIFMRPTDPFSVRFKVRADVWLAPEYAIPIGEDRCWNHLSFTKNLQKKSQGWTGMVRSSLRHLEEEDGKYLEKILLEQRQSPVTYELDETDRKKFKVNFVNAAESQISVTIPDDEQEHGQATVRLRTEQRESIQIQALLCKIGEKMNLNIWLPRSDRSRVLEHWTPEDSSHLLERLPLNYDDVTLKTVENIDVLWIRNRSIVRAFEVEHTTSIYSGILRMADLMALQPNLAIKAHIVAPDERRDKVLKEISRPVFALLEKGPLAESCTYIPYESVRELAENPKLKFIQDAILDVYAEFAAEG